jgi:hypothetical protein
VDEHLRPPRLEALNQSRALIYEDLNFSVGFSLNDIAASVANRTSLADVLGLIYRRCWIWHLS